MSIAIGIVFKENKFLFECLDETGKLSYCEISSLVTNSLPSGNFSWRSYPTSTEFKDWRGCRPEEYFNAHNIRFGANSFCYHKFFQFTTNRFSYVIPALAIIHAFFTNKELFPLIFKINGLETFCFKDSELDWPDAKLRIGEQQARLLTKPLREQLSWFLNFSSAFSMCASIHQGATSGIIDISLPKARCKVRLKGKLVERTYFVTELHFDEVHPLEEPSYDMHFPSRKIKWSPRYIDRTHVPDNFAPTTRAEWLKIRSLLQDDRPQRRPLLEAQPLFDLVLRKLVTEESWRDIDCGNITAHKAAWHFRIWRADGRLDKAIQALIYLRK